jgi:hypothetical protein
MKDAKLLAIVTGLGVLTSYNVYYRRVAAKNPR